MVELKRLFQARYTVVISPHHPSRPVTFTVSFQHMALFLFGVTLCGALGITAVSLGSRALHFRNREKVLAEKIKNLGHEVLEMRRVAQQVALLEKDLRFLLSKNDPRSLWQESPSANKRPDTIGELLVGKLPDSALNDVIQEKNRLLKQSKSLTDLASVFLINQQNLYRRELSLPTDAPATGALTSSYGWREHPFMLTSNQEHHSGIDLANIEGTPIRAAADGIVRKAGWLGGFGRTVILDHGFGFSTLYGHASRIAASNGEFVRRGEVIAYMGSTGRATGSHLHFEIWRHGKPINPLQIVSLENIAGPRDAYAQKIPLNLGIGGGAQ